MKSVKTNELATGSLGQVGRRLFFKKVALTGAGFALAGLTLKVQAQQVPAQPNQPEAESGHDYPMPTPNAQTEADFRNGVIGPAMLSLATSQIAVTKATNAKALEFAKFELREAIGVTTVLKEMGTQVPPMDANAKATLEKIQSAAKGAAFDKEYIKAQIANHEFLRDLAAGYIKNSTGKTAMPEVHGRHLAMLTLGQFKDHVVLTKDVMQMLG